LGNPIHRFLELRANRIKSTVWIVIDLLNRRKFLSVDLRSASYVFGP
jgi:hypothetical protein